MICDTEEDVVAYWSSSPILSKLLKTNYIQYKCCSHRCIDCSMNKMKRKSFNLRSQVWLYIVKHLFKLSIWIFGDNPKSINSWLYVLSTYCRWLFKVHCSQILLSTIIVKPMESITNSSEQNGLIKRKHGHLLSITRCIFSQSRVFQFLRKFSDYTCFCGKMEMNNKYRLLSRPSYKVLFLVMDHSEETLSAISS